MGILQFIVFIAILAFCAFDGYVLKGDIDGQDYEFVWRANAGAYVMMIGIVLLMHGTISIYYHMKRYDVVDQQWLKSVINPEAETGKEMSDHKEDQNLKNDESTQRIDSERECRLCGNLMKIGWKVCPHCGERRERK